MGKGKSSGGGRPSRKRCFKKKFWKEWVSAIRSIWKGFKQGKSFRRENSFYVSGGRKATVGEGGRGKRIDTLKGVGEAEESMRRGDRR